MLNWMSYFTIPSDFKRVSLEEKNNYDKQRNQTQTD